MLIIIFWYINTDTLYCLFFYQSVFLCLNFDDNPLIQVYSHLVFVCVLVPYTLTIISGSGIIMRVWLAHGNNTSVISKYNGFTSVITLKASLEILGKYFSLSLALCLSRCLPPSLRVHRYLIIWLEKSSVHTQTHTCTHDYRIFC